MFHQLSISLIITLVGMGLVFGAILLLWGLMAFLVRFAKDPQEVVQPNESEEVLKHRAAIAAVSVALEQASGSVPHEFPLPPTALVSAWQAVMRSRIFNKRGPVR